MLTTTGPERFVDEVAVFRSALERQISSPAVLEQMLERIYRSFEQQDFYRYDVFQERGKAPETMMALFDLQQELRASVARWHAAGLMSRPAQKSARDCLRAARYAIDILGELWIGYQQLSKEARTYRAFSGTSHNTLLNRNFPCNADGTLDFQSGDLILTRGSLHNSAAIARIGDIDSQFSHVAMVYIDPRGRHWAVESLIERGGVVDPLDKWLDHDLGRAVLFRHRDPVLAQRAATMIHDRIQHSLSPAGKKIRYDFSMTLDPKTHNLYCSKLVRRAFKEASDGAVVLPTFTTRLDMKNRDFPRRIGVRAVETFAPGDLELEPDFDIVAEWRDYRVTSELRLKDIVMDKLFEWMERDGYKFEETLKIRLISILGRMASYLSHDVKKMIDDVIPVVPVNMKRSAIAAIAMLHETAEPIYQEIKAIENERMSLSGLPLHPREVRQILERMLESKGATIGYLLRPVE
ncbi:MAG: YiiX/YebB-like N1pC/P60 family cysteine hydrolase [Filomicrobium sp.]